MKFRIFRSLAKSKSDAPIGINRSIRRLFVFLFSLVAAFLATTLNAETARADNLSIKIDTSGFFLRHGEQEIMLYSFHTEIKDDTSLVPIIKDVRLVNAAEGNSYLFIEINLGGNCGNVAHLATYYDNEIQNLRLPSCGAWSVVQPDIILAYDSIWGMCGRDGSRSSAANFPVPIRVGAYSDRGISIERISVYEALKVDRLEIAFQRVFDAAQRGIDLSKVTEIDELLFCESLTEDASIASKYELLLGAWPTFGEVYDMESE